MQHLPDWKLQLLADPKLSDRQYHLLRLGATNLTDVVMIQWIKFQYFQTHGQETGTTE